MAINFLSSAAVNIHGPDIGTESMKGFCSFNGFMIQVFVVQSKADFFLSPNKMLIQISGLLGAFDSSLHLFDSGKSFYSVDLGTGT